MPCTELFDKQDKAYQQKVLGNAPKISIEAASTFGWHKYADEMIGIDSFGASGKAGDVYNHFGISVDEIVKRVEKVIK